MTGDTVSFGNAGSRWHRWEPHIHAPGTVLNDQYGTDAWDDYLSELEKSQPAIRALAVTDYYVTSCYRRIVESKNQGRLPNCELIFPNVEMRLDAAAKTGFVNAHLLVDPTDPDHLQELERFLGRLRFSALDDEFGCSHAELLRYGKKFDASLDDKAALKYAATQFKVSFSQLRAEFKTNSWARKNVLVGVAGGSSDGTSGLKAASDAAVRQEIEKFADIIFSGSPEQRLFWAGKSKLPVAAIRDQYRCLKACLHGSDAHEMDDVGSPALDRFSWIKGAITFDSLRQACIEPDGRAFVGASPPPGAAPSQVIERVKIANAPWAITPDIDLNAGLVAIIGARGSGKTALADIIAAGCDADETDRNEQSFLARATKELAGATVELSWGDGETFSRAIDGSEAPDWDAYEKARYLSQQFVERLCSTKNGLTDELLGQVEEVVFRAHDAASRGGAENFDELLRDRATRHRNARERSEEALSTLSDRIAAEREKIALIGPLRRQVQDREQTIARLTLDRAKLVSPGSQLRLNRLIELQTASNTVNGYIRYYVAREQSLLGMQDEVRDVRTNQAPEALRKARERHKPSNLTDPQWDAFLLDYTGDVNAVLDAALGDTRTSAAAWRGATPSRAESETDPFFEDDAELAKLPAALLAAEIARLQALISNDRLVSDRFTAFSNKIVEETNALTAVRDNLMDCEGASARLTALVSDRETLYADIFGSIVSEERVLIDLYAPIRDRLLAAPGTLQKLAFSVKRTANLDEWARAGEQLVDLRRRGPFKGKGTIQELAEGLKQVWETGDAKQVSAAMAEFRKEHDTYLLEASRVAKANTTSYRTWLRDFARWLYSTSHIEVHYSVDYDGMDIRKLSPGTRGIVLLLLYLALDEEDDRPLIIDQPEENLDPKSVFDELVALFIKVKQRRQVIIVTHNANLVVNTDADQVIVASAGPHTVGELPPITYRSGGLEDQEIRKSVCDILEGGEEAFRERARRLRVQLDR